VFEARHGGEALRVLAAEPGIALVLSDLHMPGVDGFELSARARAMGSALPMLFMSGSSGAGTPRGDELPDMVPGRDRFIQKPFEVGALLTTVREMLEPA
jgi:CheY-like chemotaxis protein